MNGGKNLPNWADTEVYKVVTQKKLESLKKALTL